MFRRGRRRWRRFRTKERRRALRRTPQPLLPLLLPCKQMHVLSSPQKAVCKAPLLRLRLLLRPIHVKCRGGSGTARSILLRALLCSLESRYVHGIEWCGSGSRSFHRAADRSPLPFQPFQLRRSPLSLSTTSCPRLNGRRTLVAAVACSHFSLSFPYFRCQRGSEAGRPGQREGDRLVSLSPPPKPPNERTDGFRGMRLKKGIATRPCGQPRVGAGSRAGGDLLDNSLLFGVQHRTLMSDPEKVRADAVNQREGRST